MKIPMWWLSAAPTCRALAILVAVGALVASGLGSGATVLAHPAAGASAVLGGPRPGGTVVHAATCEQAPPQSVKDRTTYTPAELARYGLPPRLPGESFVKWAKVVRTAGRRICDYTRSTEQFVTGQNPNWGGYAANEPATHQTYTEADMDYYVPCMANEIPPNNNSGLQPGAIEASWIGIGGYNNGKGGGVLVQAGTADWMAYDPIHGWQATYITFFEDTGASNVHANYSFSVNCGNHLYVKAWDSGSQGCMYIQRISDGVNSGTQCLNAKSDENSAEAIVEYNYSRQDFAKFGSQTFYGVGFTDNGSYKGFLTSGVSYAVAVPYYCTFFTGFSCKNNVYGDQLAAVGGISYDAGDVPYDEYTVYWKNWS